VIASVGRRLALLNTAVVVAVIALIGIATLSLLRQNLDREADRALAERAAVARETWADRFSIILSSAQATPIPQADDDDRVEDGSQVDQEADGERKDDEAHELVESGDILLFAVDARGRLLANARGLPVPGLPDQSGVMAALAGDVDARSIEIADETIRVYTSPVRIDGQIVGAVQAARSDREHQAELRLVGVMGLVGVGLGTIVAVPVGLFLARRAMRPIDAAFARQRAFVADASHELRTPLTLIRATTELVQRLPDASKAVREELDGVLDEVDATNRLVGDLLLLARFDSDDLPLRRELLDLGSVVRAAATTFTPLAETAGLILLIETAPRIMVNADADRIRQVLRILLDNAIAYTPAGGSVRVVVEQRGTRAVVAVGDTGTGIPPAEHARVFDRFYRADRARSRGAGGTGLGLAIARALVRAHHGDIGLDSPGQGTRVWFTLPLAQER
jgi:signal transduction histidine kinase